MNIIFLEAQNNNSDILYFKSKNDYKFNKVYYTLSKKIIRIKAHLVL